MNLMLILNSFDWWIFIYFSFVFFFFIINLFLGSRRNVVENDWIFAESTRAIHWLTDSQYSLTAQPESFFGREPPLAGCLARRTATTNIDGSDGTEWRGEGSLAHSTKYKCKVREMTRTFLAGDNAPLNPWVQIICWFNKKKIGVL